MKQLYAPWRSNYARDNDHQPTRETCVFCTHFEQEDDEKNLILRRFAHNIVILNRFPYNAGHLMVIPLQHTPHLHELSSEARNEMIQLTSAIIPILEQTLRSQGMNVGLNMGRPAGGSVPHHLHLHILPRWTGDTNFLATLADTKPISFDLYEIYQKLKPGINTLTI